MELLAFYRNMKRFVGDSL